MLVVERHDRIRELVDTRRVISTDDLAQVLAVSAETVRRDLLLLDGQGLLRRVHGGAMACAAHVGVEPPFADRETLASSAKSVIGTFAAGLVTSGQTVVFDVGTTAAAAARSLPASFVGTVATCSLLVAAQLAERPSVEVLICGGRVRRGDLAVSNAQALSFFADLHADVAFLGCGGVDAEAGLTDFYPDEVATRRVILANSALSYVLADSSKLSRVAPHRVCGLDQLSAVITDRRPPVALQRAAERAGARIHTAA
ncbi:DeoR/GlpR family DNA-binding transcription regulator [Jatrophihabitans telluris]|uniref:Lactose phosphotransferase system repressor n=1 Tax=Jatrophihabitans telluris TaxID=2038343 RepID=A0ABY4QVG7_9ACTN|nr:DeoR/GlpR family DNA-binding transcription regulator [Jatrophihabitans telluris]UQX86985.1 DeoR/GlpR family DNA-binding transcription regulator [Jatrophihabitans telluris]